MIDFFLLKDKLIACKNRYDLTKKHKDYVQYQGVLRDYMKMINSGRVSKTVIKNLSEPEYFNRVKQMLNAFQKTGSYFTFQDIEKSMKKDKDVSK
jgi:hypothetical protein